jgi:hypothetical protein
MACARPAPAMPLRVQMSGPHEAGQTSQDSYRSALTS